MTVERPATAVLLDLEPHAEGGWFRRMWTGSVEVETPAFTLRELNNPEDVSPIEDALAMAGLE